MSVTRSQTAHNREPQRLNRLRRLAHTLDSSITLPGGYRIGLDGLIGLIPGVGDLAGSALSTYIVVEAARLGVSRLVLVRMMLNVMLETAVGVIPIIGDLFDFAWKANNRNIALLEQSYRPDGNRQEPMSRRLGGAVILLFTGFVLLLIAVIALSVQALLGLFSATGA